MNEEISKRKVLAFLLILVILITILMTIPSVRNPQGVPRTDWKYEFVTSGLLTEVTHLGGAGYKGSGKSVIFDGVFYDYVIIWDTEKQKDLLPIRLDDEYYLYQITNRISGDKGYILFQEQIDLSFDR